MRKYIVSIWILIGYSTGLMAQSQYDPKARGILDAMSAKYRSIPSFKATITHSLVNEVEELDDEFKGEITVKGDMYKLKLSGQEIINNGTTIWTYLEEVNEVNITDHDPDEDDISPSKIYDLYKTGYKYLWLKEKNVGGEMCDIVDLIPENQESQFFRIRMEISKKDKTLKSWQMFDKTGNIYGYEITKFISNPDIDDTFFSFDESAHSGVEIIDFR